MTLSDDIRKASDEIKANYDELGGESARAAAILAVTLLEDELDRLIRRKFPDDVNEKLWKKICGPGHAPLGSFSTKADVAQAFGYFGPKTRRTLELIARVRNRFAHTSTARQFTDKRILPLCTELLGNPYPNAEGSDRPYEGVVRYDYLSKVRELHEALEIRSAYVRELDVELDPLP